MKHVEDDLRAQWQLLAEVEEGLPGHDYDRGYQTGWYDARRGNRARIRPDGGYRDPERVLEFRKGYKAGLEDGVDRVTDWYPDFALGQMVPDTAPPTYPPQAIPGTGEPVRLALRRIREERALQAAAPPKADTGHVSRPGAAA